MIFPKPRGGGSAKHAIFYVLAEETSHKPSKQFGTGLTPDQIRSVHELFAEANERSDLGARSIWSPKCRDGKRPSSIYARGVNALSTAPEDIGCIVGTNSHIKSPVYHYGISVDANFSKTVSDERLLKFAEFVVDRAGFEGHAAIFAVHREKTHAHVHCVISAVSSVTMRAYRRQNELGRLHESLRYGEIAFGFPTDNGRYVIRDRGLATERVERANADERRASRQANIDQRLANQAGRFISQEEGLESLADRADRLRFKIERYFSEIDSHGKKALRADLHSLAATLCTRIERSDAGGLVFRLMEKAPKDFVLDQYEDDFGEQRTRYATWLPTEHTIHIPIAEAVPSPFDVRTSGSPFHRLAHERALFHREWLADLGDVERAEEEVRAVIAEDPARISRDLVDEGRATLTPVDFDAWAQARVTDDWEDVANRALREDKTLVILSANAEMPLFTTKAQQELEQSNFKAASRLAQTEDPLWNPNALALAIAEVESEKGFELTDEQKAAVANIRYRYSVIQGVSGSGKSSIMAVLVRYSELIERPIAGFATAQSAAERLGQASGMQSVNPARALALEGARGEAMVKDDAIVVVDESSMFSHRAAGHVLDRVEARGANAVFIGDVAQLSNLEAGDTFRVLIQAALKNNTFSQVRRVFRQKDGPEVQWLLDAIPKATEAIKTQDRVAFRDFLLDLIERGHVTFHRDRKDEVASVAAKIVAAERRGEGYIAEAFARTDCRNINRAVRKELGLEGGVSFRFDHGWRQLSPGTRVVFERNDEHGLGVLNGYVGTVTEAVGGDDPSVTVCLESGRDVTFDPRVYRWIDHGWAVSHYKAQGLEEPLAIVDITRSDNAHSAHMAFSRCLQGLTVDTRLSPEEFVEHLSSAQSLRPKDDALFFREIVDRTGGPGTPWALATKRALEHDKDPLRQRYYREIARLQAEKGEAIQALLFRNQSLRPRDPKLRRAFDAGEKRDLLVIEKRYELLPFAKWSWRERELVEREWTVRENARLKEQAKMFHVEPSNPEPLAKPAPGIDLLAQQRAQAQQEEEEFRQILRDRADRAEAAKHARNIATARAALVPLSGTIGELYLLKRAVSTFDDTMYCATWGQGFETNDSCADGSPKISKGHGPAIVAPFYDPVTREILGYQGRYITPPVFDGRELKVWSVGPAKRGVFATKGAWDAREVFIGEGIVDKLSMLSIGMEGFCCAGAGNIPDTIGEAVAGRPVLIATDRDPNGAGDKMAEKLRTKLEPRSTTRRLLLPWHDRTKKVDINDVLRRSRNELESGVDLSRGLDPLLRASHNRQRER